MRKRILSYRKHIDELLNTSPDGTNWDDIMKEHLVQVSFFQHERLIHLIVTVLFALLTVLSLGFGIVTMFWQVLLLALLLIILLVPYIYHYYLLENEVQKMYTQYDRLLIKQSEAEKRRL